jgi:hypothetical protein
MRTIIAKLAALLCCLVIALATSALYAKDGAAAEPPPVKGYTMQYTLVILITFLGVFVACRPGRRSSEVKKQREFEE